MRGAGILLHPTSLPGPCGSGDLGPAAYRFVDTLAATGVAYWQVLPLGPTGYGDSPYQTFSAFAGNPLLVSPELLIAEGLLPALALDEAVDYPLDSVDYGRVIPFRQHLLTRAFDLFEREATTAQRTDVESFARAESDWLAPFALYYGPQRRPRRPALDELDAAR